MVLSRMAQLQNKRGRKGRYMCRSLGMSWRKFTFKKTHFLPFDELQYGWPSGAKCQEFFGFFHFVWHATHDPPPSRFCEVCRRVTPQPVEKCSLVGKMRLRLLFRWAKDSLLWKRKKVEYIVPSEMRHTCRRRWRRRIET